MITPDFSSELEVWCQHVLKSYHQLLCRPLITCRNQQKPARELFMANFALVTHDHNADPKLNFGNRQALQLWEMPWTQFIGTPSRLTAEPVAREERQRLLDTVSEKGFIDHYSGIRISATGRRFRIENAIVWNVFDQDQVIGQAAMFHSWKFV